MLKAYRYKLEIYTGGYPGRSCGAAPVTADEEAGIIKFNNYINTKQQ